MINKKFQHGSSKLLKEFRKIRNRNQFNYIISVSGCGGLLNGSSGLFSTPGFPYKSYSGDLNCVWTLSIPTNGFVVIEFLEFDTEQG